MDGDRWIIINATVPRHNCYGPHREELLPRRFFLSVVLTELATVSITFGEFARYSLNSINDVPVDLLLPLPVLFFFPLCTYFFLVISLSFVHLFSSPIIPPLSVFRIILRVLPPSFLFSPCKGQREWASHLKLLLRPQTKVACGLRIGMLRMMGLGDTCLLFFFQWKFIAVCWIQFDDDVCVAVVCCSHRLSVCSLFLCLIVICRNLLIANCSLQFVFSLFLFICSSFSCCCCRRTEIDRTRKDQKVKKAEKKRKADMHIERARKKERQIQKEEGRHKRALPRVGLSTIETLKNPTKRMTAWSSEDICVIINAVILFIIVMMNLKSTNPSKWSSHNKYHLHFHSPHSRPLPWSWS